MVIFLDKAHEKDGHRDHDRDTDYQEGIGILLHVVGQVHAEYPRDYGTEAHDESPDLNEQTHLDDLVSDAVQMGGDELVSVLDHVDKDLDLREDFVEIGAVGAQQKLHVLVQTSLSGGGKIET